MRQGFASIAAIVFIGLLILMLLNELDHVRVQLTADGERGPDIVLHGTDMRTYDLNGKLEYRVSAARIEHRDLDGLSLLERPLVEVHRDNQVWQIRSRQGQVDQHDRLLQLRGEVQAELDGPSPVLLTTAELHYHVRAHLLSIPTEVNIQHSGGRTRAGSLEADMNAGTLTMQQGVETHYVPDA
jgi:lipopolysaccharide export system protein LptC